MTPKERVQRLEKTFLFNCSTGEFQQAVADEIRWATEQERGDCAEIANKYMASIGEQSHGIEAAEHQMAQSIATAIRGRT